MNREPTKYSYSDKKEIGVKLPECCVEARDDCPHVAKKEREKKTNVGL